jgi:hypothetical protein
MSPNDLLMLGGGIVVAIALVIVVRARQRSHTAEQARVADEVVCVHLRPAIDLLKNRGHRARRVGQNHPDLPMEIHVTPPFDPQSLCDELKLTEPVFVSERNVLYCKEDWCEIHPVE